MRPRWHFILLSALTAVGACIVLLTLIYTASLAVFLMRDSGAWVALSFGGRGWFSFLHALPWLLIIFSIVFIGLLEVLVRRYAFVYRSPLLLSIAGILILITSGGLLIAGTPFHRQMKLYAEHHQLPSPLSFVYGIPFRIPAPDVYEGNIIARTPDGFVIDDENGSGTTTIRITGKTRLPYGQDFSLGTHVVILGDAVSSSTVVAFGVQEDDE